MVNAGETICAPASGKGGAISVIRVSGPASMDICEKIFAPLDARLSFSSLKGYSIVFGEIREGDEVIDEVLVSIFRAPHSYTGEDSVEISCHASGFIVRKILELIVRSGAVPASPGEFTQRAFLNGKMDLSQAEAVADLIAAESARAHRLAISQIRGTFSDEISKLRADLLHFASLIELELDFGEEDVEFADRKELREIVSKALAMANELTSSFSIGNAVKNGVPVVIAGQPNTGKSTLLNVLLKDDKAIVSEIPGTTRDFIEDTIVIDGILFRFIDTAGLRSSDDTIEKLGIERTYRKLEDASIILLVADVNEGLPALEGILNELRNEDHYPDKKIIILINKIDNDAEGKQQEFIDHPFLKEREKMLLISARNGSGIAELKDKLVELSGIGTINSEDVIITNIRHYEALYKVSESLSRVLTGLDEKLPDDLVAIDVRQAIHYLGEISGEITTEEILGNIFKNFCIGK
jgi:tRNA modification GTPase